MDTYESVLSSLYREAEETGNSGLIDSINLWSVYLDTLTYDNLEIYSIRSAETIYHEFIENFDFDNVGASGTFDTERLIAIKIVIHLENRIFDVRIGDSFECNLFERDDEGFVNRIGSFEDFVQLRQALREDELYAR